jgi:hypothetical protein
MHKTKRHHTLPHQGENLETKEIGFPRGFFTATLPRKKILRQKSILKNR